MFLLLSSISHGKGYKLISLITIMMIFPLTIIQVISSQKYDHNKDEKWNKFEKKFIVVTIIFISIILLPLLIYLLLIKYIIFTNIGTVINDNSVVAHTIIAAYSFSLL